MNRLDAADWDVACMAELCAFEEMGVYEFAPWPKGRKVVGSKWIFRIKRGPDGAIQKYKACLVAQGFTQVEIVDYDNVCPSREVSLAAQDHRDRRRTRPRVTPNGR